MKKFKFTKTNIRIIAICVAAVVAVVAMILIMKNIEESEYSYQDHMNNAEAFFGMGEYDSAIAAYKQAIRLDADSIDAYVGQARSYAELGGTANAVDLYKTAITLITTAYNDNGELYSDANDVYYECADIYVEAGDSKSAYTLLKEGETVIDGLLTGYEQYASLEVYVIADMIQGEPTDEYTGSFVTSETGDVLFGSYPQNEVAGEELTDSIINAEYTDDVATVDGVRYKRVEKTSGYRYFRYEDIAWQIVQDTTQGYIVMSVYVLDGKLYNETASDVVWETSSLRKWLLDDFYNEAFSTEEQAKLVQMQVGNSTTTEGAGTAIMDYVALVNINEICKGGAYIGFEYTMIEADEDREASATAYADARGVYTDSTGNCKWWLRTPGVNFLQAMYVNTNGIVAAEGFYVNGSGFGVRPIICIPKDVVTQ